MTGETIYYRKADGTAREMQVGTPAQVKMENDPVWSRVFASQKERDAKWEKSQKKIAEKFMPKKAAPKKRKRSAKK